eukprot:gene21850-22826_t
MGLVWDAPIVTELSPVETYYKAEDYHQNYFQQHPFQGYCAFIVAPKLAKFREVFTEKSKPDVAIGFAADDLIEGNPVLIEAMSAAGKVDAPDAIVFFIRDFSDLLRPSFKIVSPDGTSAGIVTAEILDVEGFQPALLHGLEHDTDMRQFSRRENIFINEFSAAISKALMREKYKGRTFNVNLALDIGFAKIGKRWIEKIRQRRDMRHAQGNLRARVTEIKLPAIPQFKAQWNGRHTTYFFYPGGELLFPKHDFSSV